MSGTVRSPGQDSTHDSAHDSGRHSGQDRSTRARITRAALELFEERGYDATTVEAIAERAGVGRTTFFRTFGSKEEVVFPDHPALLDRVEARLAAATPDAHDVALLEAARLVLEHYLAEGDLARARYRLTTSVPALRAREVAGIQQYQRLFRRYIRSWLGPTGNPELNPDLDPALDPGLDLEAELLAAAVVTAHNHVLRRWLRGDPSDPRTTLDAAMRHAVRPVNRSGPGVEGVGVAGTTVVVLRSGEDVDSLLPRLRAALQQP